MRELSEYLFVPLLFRANLDQYTRIARVGYVLLHGVNNKDWYVTTTYHFHELHICVWGWYVTTTYFLYTNYEIGDTCVKFRVLSFQFVVDEPWVSFDSGSVCPQASQTCFDRLFFTSFTPLFLFCLPNISKNRLRRDIETLQWCAISDEAVKGLYNT